MDPNLTARLPDMTDEELYALDPADLDRVDQDALLRELGRRRRQAESQADKTRDIARWKTWGCYVRWGLFTLLVAVLAVAGYLSKGG